MSSSATSIGADVVVDWVRLAGTEGIGPIAFHQLMARSGSAAEALRRLPEIAARGGRKRKIVPPDQSAVERLIEDGARQKILPLLAVDPRYPETLKALDDGPPILWIKGDPALLARPCIAMVGARNASLSGRKIANAWAAELAGAGLTVVSGLARGIDGAAHEGALSKGKTVAVMAGGVDAIYPSEHRALWQRVVDTGAVISELPPGTEPIAPLFPRRNRIISGLSRAVVVVEATLKSGSLITARYALDQGREVLAAPGSPLEPRAEGPNSLIRDGATLVQSVSDILAALGALAPTPESPRRQIHQPVEKYNENEIESVRGQILALISADPVSVDELIRQCQTSAPVLAQALLELELAGRLVRLPGNRVAAVLPA
ncbi:MAG: DNA-protecting protein DprA [Alphaproteobacteria bacterium]|nr:DNA-protecting protein DprA [Alphaproteobacteria bacterium]